MANTFKFNDNTTCPTNCTRPLFPALPVLADCPTGATLKSQMCDLILDITGDVMTGITTDDAGVTAWTTTNVDNTNTDNTKARHLVGIGSGSEPALTERDGPKGRVNITSTIRTQTWTFETASFDVNEFFRYLECNAPQKFMYGNTGGWAFVGEEGIDIETFKCYPVEAGGKDDVYSWTIVIGYDSKISPKAINSPWL